MPSQPRSTTSLTLTSDDSTPHDYGLIPVICTALMITITWETLLYSMNFTLVGGGPAGAMWAYIFVWVGKASAFATLGELASMAPHTSGQPYWIGLLADPSWSKIASYVAAWVQLLGWIALTTTGAYMSALAVVIVVEFADVGYIIPKWLILIIMWAALLVSIVANIMINKKLKLTQVALATLHFFTLLAMLLPAIYWMVGPNVGDVFTLFINNSGWESHLVGFMLSTIGPLYAFCGCDSPIFLSDDFKMPDTMVPRAMMTTILINGVVGLLTLLVFLVADINRFQSEPWTPDVQTWDGLAQFIEGPGSISLGIVMAVCLAAAFVYWIAMAARFLWLVAQVNGVPGSKYLKKNDDKYTSIPIFAFLTVGFICAILIIGLDWKLEVWRDCICLAVMAIDLPTFVCNLLLLRQRLMGGMIRPDAIPTAKRRLMKRMFVWGPWRIPEPWGTVNNIFACGFHLWVLFFSAFPRKSSMPEGLNITPFIVIGTAVVSAIWYRFRGHKNYLAYAHQPRSYMPEVLNERRRKGETCGRFRGRLTATAHAVVSPLSAQTNTGSDFIL